MPGVMSRLLVELIQDRIVNVVIATSTLTEGVNLPFEVILIPSIRRGKDYITVSEFANIIGRAGRPGTSTEGRTLVLIDPTSTEYNTMQNHETYRELIKALTSVSSITAATTRKDVGPLERLIVFIYSQWSKLAKSSSTEEFFSWLEITACYANGGEPNDAIDSLDTLDGILLGAIAEVESQLTDGQSTVDYEDVLRGLWRSSFSYYSSTAMESLEKIILARGRAVCKTLYPDKEIRKRLYKTSLVPREGKKLIDSIPSIKALFKKGDKYYTWVEAERINYIVELIDALQSIKSFKIDKTTKQENWKSILHWWLDPSSAPLKPTPVQVSKWYNYGAQNFTYKLNWGLGCSIGIILQDTSSDKSTLDRWSEEGLPWSVFWLKDIITWGVLDPVAVYLMMNGTVDTRAEATEQAAQYWQQVKGKLSDAVFDPRKIAEWAPVSIERHLLFESEKIKLDGFPCKVKLTEDFGEHYKQTFRVFPVLRELTIDWIDPAGFVLANGMVPMNWDNSFIESHDFTLDPQKKSVLASRYL
jgi:hypothetical protein